MHLYLLPFISSKLKALIAYAIRVQSWGYPRLSLTILGNLMAICRHKWCGLQVYEYIQGGVAMSFGQALLMIASKTEVAWTSCTNSQSLGHQLSTVTQVNTYTHISLLQISRHIGKYLILMSLYLLLIFIQVGMHVALRIPFFFHVIKCFVLRNTTW